MIIPVRCFTCSKVIADLWEEYQKQINEKKSIKFQVLIVPLSIILNTFYLNLNAVRRAVIFGSPQVPEGKKSPLQRLYISTIGCVSNKKINRIYEL